VSLPAEIASTAPGHDEAAGMTGGLSRHFFFRVDSEASLRDALISPRIVTISITMVVSTPKTPVSVQHAADRSQIAKPNKHNCIHSS
jgi:hypothetical protein